MNIEHTGCAKSFLTKNYDARELLETSSEDYQIVFAIWLSYEDCSPAM
jgi:hypothetical protein